MVRKINSNTSKESIYNGKNNLGKMIENTAFSAGSNIPTKHVSIKYDVAQRKNKKLHYKIAKAITQIDSDDKVYYLDKKNILIAALHGGSMNGTEYIVYDIDTHKIEATNPYSFLVLKMMIPFAIIRFINNLQLGVTDEKAPELFQCLETLGIKENDFVDTNVRELIHKCATSLEWEWDFFFESGGIILEEDIDVLEQKYNQLKEESEYDVTNLLYLNSAVTDADKKYYTLPKKHIVETKQVKNKWGLKVEDPVGKDYALLSDDAAKKMPLELQLSRQKAISLFERNKDFLEREDWEMIRSAFHGNLWKVGFFGPSGTGKTTKIIMMAGALKLPYEIIVGSKGIEEGRLFGKYILKDGNTEFKYGALSLMVKYGGVFLFDEVNMVEPEILAAMNGVLDSTRQVRLDNEEVIEAHPNFRYAEAMNLGYNGTTELNLSHESRIQRYVKLAKNTPDKETKIVVQETGIPNKLAKKMVSLKNQIEELIKNSGDDTTQRVDLRTCIDWAFATLDCGDPVLASLTTVGARLAKDDDNIQSTASVEVFLKSDSLAGDAIGLIDSELAIKTEKTQEIIWKL